MRNNKEPGYHIDGRLWVPDGYDSDAEVDDDDDEPETPPGGSGPGPGATATAPAAPLSLEQALYETRALRIRDADPRPTDASEVIGQDDALAQARVILGSSSPSHMIFTGPPGVGKTTIARLAMQLAMSSPTCRFKSDAPFVEVDCTTLYSADNGMNSLCTTVVEGYYSDSVRAYCTRNGLPANSSMVNLGATSRAHGGILLLDEIGEMPAELQNKLLKVLEDGYERLTTTRFDPTATYPAWYRSFMTDGVPAAFVMVACTTRSPSELVPALRSRSTVIQFRALNFEERTRVAAQAATKYGYTISQRAINLIASTSEGGRDSARKVQVAVSLAAARASTEIDSEDVPKGSVTLPARAVCIREGAHATALSSLVCDSRRCLRCGLRIPPERKVGQCTCGRTATYSVVIADDEHAAEDVCSRCRKLIGHACVAVTIDHKRFGGDAAAGARFR
jgi:Holliday junction resolvasome RuvABC ATP-dependent DNA helicase subunit